ncbi:MAG: enoyl-CoA hydratase/isomerase family protein [Pseudomonadota bacterium]
MHDRYELIDYVRRDGIAEIILNRQPVNAFSVQLLEEILGAMRAAAADDAVRVVLLRSALPKVFCAGLDLDIILDSDALKVRAFLERLYSELYDVQHHMDKPTVAVVGGSARGGGMTLAISCDMIVASDAATFGYPELEIGVVPAIHFMHLPRIVGRYRAFDLLFSCRAFDAAEAHALGLVSRVSPSERLEKDAMALARSLAAKPPVATRLARRAFMRANDLDYRRGVANAVEDFVNVATLPEAQEGLRAFLEKRAPSWKG